MVGERDPRATVQGMGATPNDPWDACGSVAVYERALRAHDFPVGQPSDESLLEMLARHRRRAVQVLSEDVGATSAEAIRECMGATGTLRCVSRVGTVAGPASPRDPGYLALLERSLSDRHAPALGWSALGTAMTVTAMEEMTGRIQRRPLPGLPRPVLDVCRPHRDGSVPLGVRVLVNAWGWRYHPVPGMPNPWAPLAAAIWQGAWPLGIGQDEDGYVWLRPVGPVCLRAHVGDGSLTEALARPRR